ncbi:diguanylate cyclase [Rhodoferax aquaticus]|uniref:diguanylate cyclase n=2 Tax=Rhodoferax aquaticus TaxID=2527691 RepID=A0A515EW48_9BURK|nr:diguanylate cyclase [Rhodoferax aquaticus]
MPISAPAIKPKILIVDDQPINVQALHQVFADGYQIFMATRGEQALSVCASKQPDLVLLDVEMPGMDGFEVCERLRADPLTRDIPVIFVTAHRDEASETRGLELGAVDFISKPFNPNIVRARVKTQLTLKAQADLLRSWAYLDGLTGICNRRHFDEQLKAEWERSLREKTPLSVLMLDVDFFKRYNDRYGHQEGDKCLRLVACCIQSSLKRPADMAARYGGEEFVCLLPNTDLEGAMQLAHAVGQSVMDLSIPHSDSLVAPVITISIGACAKPAELTSVVPHAAAQEPTPPSLEDLMRKADGHLYAAKVAGRNKALGGVL